MLLVVNNYIGGSGEIRTHGPFRAGSFQDCCNKPDSATLPELVPRTGFEPATELSLEQPRLPDCLRHRGIGSAGEIRTHDFTDLQSDPLDHSGTALHLASHHGFEPRPRVLETRMLPLH